MNEVDNSKVNSTPHWRFWGTLLWGFLIGGSFVFLQTVTFVGYVSLVGKNDPSLEAEELFSTFQYNGFVLSISTIVTAVICGALLIGIIKLKRGASIGAYLGLGKVKAAHVIRWGAWFIVLLAISDAVTIMLGRPIVPEFMTSAYSSASPLWLLWLAVIVAAPFFEECFFRGFLLRGFSSSFLGPVGAVLITSLIWAAFHLQYDLYHIATLFIIGCVLGAARIQTDSVLLVIGMHAFQNLVATIETAIHIGSQST
jgi:membrane protease YdiL (CAAX protease family)